MISKLREKVAREIMEREGPKVIERLQKERGPLTNYEVGLLWACIEYYTEELLK